MEAKQQVVAFLGPRASYTHQAATLRFPEQANNKLVPASSIEDVFAAVQSGSATQGIVPFENSSNGSVVFTLDLFADHKGKYSDILVQGEIYLPVRHCLVGHAAPSKTTTTTTSIVNGVTPSDSDSSGTATPTPAPTTHPPSDKPVATPTYDLSHIRKLYSHPQAWGQCQNFLSTHLHGIERQDVSSTSKAAELVAATNNVSDNTPSTSTAAISSALAAHLNNLTILASGIEDSEGNSTRFFVLVNRHRQKASLLQIPPPQPQLRENPTGYKTLIAFTTPNHTQPGALADSLAVFKKFRLNLTSINTRPGASGQGQLWRYVFFVEFAGRKADDGEGGEGGGGGVVNEALRELERVAGSVRWLGSWEDGLVGEGEGMGE